jgi:hypothetical protein
MHDGYIWLKILINYFLVLEFVRFKTKLSFLIFSFNEKGMTKIIKFKKNFPIKSFPTSRELEKK